MEKTLEVKVVEYANLQTQVEELQKQMDSLRGEILSEMSDLGVDKYTTTSGETAQVTLKETFKYVDEAAMINWLKANGYTQFIKEKVDTTPMNKELKKGLTLTESLKPMFTKNVTSSLSVKR